MRGEQKPLDVGEALKQRRRRLGLTLRGLEAATAELARQNPLLYERVSRPTMHEIESTPGALVRRNLGMSRLRSLVALLWDGDYAAFAHETGLSVLTPSQEAPPQGATPTLPIYLEGEQPRENAKRRARPLPQPELYVVPTHDLPPYVQAGHPVGVSRTVSPQLGDLVVLEDPHRGLHLGVYSPTAASTVYGVVVQVMPRASIV